MRHRARTRPRDHLLARRFDESFVVRTLRDFFVALVLVIVIEWGARFAVVLGSYYTTEKQRTREAAEQLAADVKSIMLNRGGPVAASTVYPILAKNFDKMGLDVAIVPSASTVASIESAFGFTPRGIAPAWPKGEHHAASVPLRAEPFCIQCHSRARPGDVLGTVAVRNYRATHLAHWRDEVGLSVVFGMGNIILHTIVLFLLLRLRMEPLLSLRATIARLSKAGSDLSHRAPVNSTDEFGELANDINLFLDRICQIIDDVAKVLGQVGTLNKRLYQVRGQMDAHAGLLQASMGRVTRAALSENGPRFDDAPLQAMLAGIEALAQRAQLPADVCARLAEVRQRWSTAHGAAPDRADFGGGIAELHRHLGGFGHFIGEMTVLEEKMQNMAEEGQRLLERLLPHQATNEAPAPGTAAA